jgi:hypothetical protein
MAKKSENPVRRTIVKKNKQVEYVTDVFCNKCGGSCSKRDRKGFNWGLYGMIDHEVYGGYGSNPLEDCTTYIFTLCEDCLVELFETFKIPVEKIEYFPGMDYNETKTPRKRYCYGRPSK